MLVAAVHVVEPLLGSHDAGDASDQSAKLSGIDRERAGFEVGYRLNLLQEFADRGKFRSLFGLRCPWLVGGKSFLPPVAVQAEINLPRLPRRRVAVGGAEWEALTLSRERDLRLPVVGRALSESGLPIANISLGKG